jgi:hypothetical protein
MRYVYQEPVISTVSDDELTDETAIKDLLLNLKRMQHNVYMEYVDPEFPDMLKKLETVRITDVRDGEIDIHAFFSTASAKLKGIPFSCLRKVRLLATKQLIAQKYRVTRWHMMDVAEVSTEEKA